MVMHWVALAVAMLMLAALFMGGAQPEAAGLIPAPWDKLAHVAFFFVFALLLSRFVSLPVAVVIVLCLLVGASNIRKDWGWSPSMAR
jgi:heme/copper-type cytochrome/quinol oxidase subunit 2